MDAFNIFAALLTLSALFAYVNHRFLGMPTTIGVMVIALAFSLALIVLSHAGLANPDWFAWFAEVEFAPTLLEGMLGFLLFAGALHVDLNDLAEQRWVVSFLATVGVLFSTLVIGVSSWLLLGALGLPLSLVH